MSYILYKTEMWLFEQMYVNRRNLRIQPWVAPFETGAFIGVRGLLQP